MQRCLWMLFAAMVFAILPREGTSAQGDNERAIMLRNLAAHLITNNLYSTRYDALLAKYNSLRGSGLCINKTVGSGDNCKTIIVVRHTEVSNPTGPYATLLARINLNAEAYAPSLILVDERWLDIIITNAVNHYTYFTRINAGNAENVFTQARYQQFINMRTTLLHENLGLKTLDDLADGYIRMLTVSPPPSNFDEPEQRLMTAVLSILIEHEVAHLDLTSPAFALRAKLETDFASNRIDQPEYRAQRRQISLNEERRADGIALDRAEKLIGAQIPNGLGSKAKAVLARVPLISISALFRDRVMFFGMEKFRNLRSEDITFEFSHYACGDKPAEGNFNEPKAIQNARERPMPVMSQAEFESARSRLLTERIGEETHDHYLVRAKLIDDRVRAGDQNDSYYFLDTSEQLSLVTALVRNDPTLAQNKSNKSLFRPLGGVSMNDILSSVRKTAKVVEAVTCPTVKCYVGYMKDDLGYLELIGDDNQLSEFRWMFKVRGYSQEQYLRLMVEMGEIFLTIGGEEPLKALVQMRNPVLCGRGAAFMETKTRVYHTTTVNRGGWIYVRIFSPKVFAAIGMPSKEELQNQKVNPSFDCELAKRPEEQAICSDPELSRLDASLSQLYKKFSGIRMVVEEQRAWLAARNKCGSDGRCLEKLYRERISTLTSQINKTLSDLQTKPSFYCALATQSDEKAICSDPFLSKLDIALSERYSGLLRDRSGAARDRLVDEQRRWLLRRRQCKDDTTCLRQLYQQRIDGLATVN